MFVFSLGSVTELGLKNVRKLRRFTVTCILYHSYQRSINLERIAVTVESNSLSVDHYPFCQLCPVYTIKQTSSNHRANIQQMHSKYMCTKCALIARCLLDDCLIV